jgi:hypothetical protein
MMEQAKPAARKLDTVKDAQRLMSKDDITIIGFFATDESKQFENFGDAGSFRLRSDPLNFSFVFQPK